MQLSQYFETLTDPFYVIVDLALERPLPLLGFAAAGLVVTLALV